MAALQQQLADAHDENKQLLGNLREWGVSPQPLPLKPDASSTTDAGTAPPPAIHAVAREGGVSSDGASPAPGVDQAVTEAEAKLQEAERQLVEVLARARAAESQVLQLQEQAAREREKVRSDQLLLAREVKKLRTELAAATQVGGSGQGRGREGELPGALPAERKNAMCQMLLRQPAASNNALPDGRKSTRLIQAA